MIQDEFGKRVNFLRQNKMMSQKELADKTGIERTQLSKIEQGKVNVTLDTIEKLALGLNVSVKYIMNFDINGTCRPFVKWAGGKTQIISKLKELMPKEYNNYFEPFIGGGALFFNVKPHNAFINDQNKELYYAYMCFKNKSDLEKLKTLLDSYSANHNEEQYLTVRAQDRLDGFEEKLSYERAARLIYLNKSCFNGLYRVNSKGYFNVPSAKKEIVNCYDKDNFENIFNYFNNSDITITNSDFEKAVEKCQKDDFVYFDPPYDVYPDKQGFVDYGKSGFDKDDQIRLYNCFEALDKRGVKVMLSNHNTEFIQSLYKNYNIHIIQARRMINSNPLGRGAIEEVIVTNY